MGRAHHSVFAPARAPRYVVVWDLHWRVIDCRRLEPAVDPRTEFDRTIAVWARDGWLAQSPGAFGFTFLARSGERRLLAVTTRDPFSTSAQSFSPFGTGKR
jgi:hypothetical protein